MVESPDKLEEDLAEIDAEVNAIQIKTEKTGVVLKADTLGSLEALVGFLHQNDVKIHKASVGPVTRNDIMDAMAIKERDPLVGVVLAFNVPVLGDAQETADDLGIRIFSQEVIYKLLEEYQGYFSTRKAEDTAAALSELVMPGKFQVIPEYIFRQSNPAIFGVKVLAGKILPRESFVRAETGEKAGSIRGMQDRGKNIPEAKVGEEVAIEVRNVTIGRQIKEDDLLYIAVPEAHARQLMNKFKNDLSDDEISALRDYVLLMRKTHSAWWGT
jgi:translation initiation factor 5B